MAVLQENSGRVGPDKRYELVAIASSAGGIRALSVVLGGLSAPFGAAIVIVQHLDRRHETMIARVLSRPARLPVRLATHHEFAPAGTVYVAPPDHHLLVGPGGRLAP